MCGISGFSGRFEEGLLEKMNRSIAHRGPDDEGRFFSSEEGIGLLHRRLTIIDLSERGHQPMWDVTRRAVIIFNGEIFNFLQLREELVSQGFEFRSDTDTEVLLNLWIRDGEAMLGKLNGMFAFAIWDTFEKVMFIARDGVGVKPLYYAETSAGLLFASELKALLTYADLARDLNPEAIHHHLAFLWCPAPHTMLKSVKKLLPGHAMLVRGGRVEKRWQFYRLPYHQAIGTPSVEEAEQDVFHHLRQAVQRQMIADVPVGAFLSGGLDSSSVVALAREFAPSRLQCFSIDFKGDTFAGEGMADDLPYARRAAEYLDVDLHVVSVGPEMADHLETMIYHLDEPQADPAPINALLISRLARETGMKVLLSGAGGDDIFTGYRRHYALGLERFWKWMPGPARSGLSALCDLAPARSAWGRRLSKAFHYAGLSGDERLVSYFYWVDNALQRSLYSKDLNSQLARVHRAQPLLDALKELPPGTPELNRMLELEARFFLADHNLNYTDKMSMAAGIEVRVPLLDPDLMACAARLPLHFKQNGKEGKWIFKKAAERFLPHDIIYRPKTGFGAPLRHWLRNQLRPLVEDILSPASLSKQGLFDPTGVQRLLDMDRKGQVDGSYTIFSLVCIELWRRLFLEGSR